MYSMRAHLVESTDQKHALWRLRAWGLAVMLVSKKAAKRGRGKVECAVSVCTQKFKSLAAMERHLVAQADSQHRMMSYRPCPVCDCFFPNTRSGRSDLCSHVYTTMNERHAKFRADNQLPAPSPPKPRAACQACRSCCFM